MGVALILTAQLRDRRGERGVELVGERGLEGHLPGLGHSAEPRRRK